MNFEEKKTTYKEVTENSDASSKNWKSESKKYITTPSKRRRKISKWVEKVGRDRCRTLQTDILLYKTSLYYYKDTDWLCDAPPSVFQYGRNASALVTVIVTLPKKLTVVNVT